MQWCICRNGRDQHISFSRHCRFRLALLDNLQLLKPGLVVVPRGSSDLFNAK